MGNKEVFEELGIFDTAVQPNPIEVIGLSTALASELLKADSSGDNLKLAVKGLYRALSQLYHPDVDSGGANTDKFMEIQTASDKINSATSASLHRWTKVAGSDVKKLGAAYEKSKQALSNRASNIYESLLDNSDHPLNYSRFTESNGLVLRLPDAIILMQPEPDGETSLTKGRSTIYSTKVGVGFTSKDLLRYVSSLDSFLSNYFQPELNDDVAGRGQSIFLTGADGMFLYDKDFDLLSDLSDKFVGAHKAIEEKSDEVSPYWMRADFPQLIELQYNGQNALEAVKVTSFQPYNKDEKVKTGMQMKWTTDYNVVGSTPEVDFIKELITARYTAPQRALSTTDQVTNLPITLQPLRTNDLFEMDSGYTPLLIPGNRLFLRNTLTQQYSISTAEIIGLLTSHKN